MIVIVVVTFVARTVYVQSGVPQGTVLRLLLFLIHIINDIADLCIFLLMTVSFTELSTKTQMPTWFKRMLADFVAGERNEKKKKNIG